MTHPIAIRHASPAETKQRIATACVCENQKMLMPARSAAKDTIVLPRELVAASSGIESDPAEGHPTSIKRVNYEVSRYRH